MLFLHFYEESIECPIYLDLPFVEDRKILYIDGYSLLHFSFAEKISILQKHIALSKIGINLCKFSVFYLLYNSEKKINSRKLV
jgi:hypothetical protein